MIAYSDRKKVCFNCKMERKQKFNDKYYRGGKSYLEIVTENFEREGLTKAEALNRAKKEIEMSRRLV